MSNEPTTPPASSKPATPAGSNAPSAPLDETDRDDAIMSVAAKRPGVVTRSELVKAGVPAHAIDYRLKRRRLHRLYRGIYRVDPIEANYEKETAAVLAYGEAAVLSHRIPAGLWKMLPFPSAQIPVEVISPAPRTAGECQGQRIRGRFLLATAAPHRGDRRVLVSLLLRCLRARLSSGCGADGCRVPGRRV